MRKTAYLLIALLIFVPLALAGSKTPPPPPGMSGDGDDGLIMEGAGDFGPPLTAASPIVTWEVPMTNSAGDEVVAFRLVFTGTDFTDGSEDGTLEIFTIQGGVLTEDVQYP